MLLCTGRLALFATGVATTAWLACVVSVVSSVPPLAPLLRAVAPVLAPSELAATDAGAGAAPAGFAPACGVVKVMQVEWRWGQWEEGGAA